MKNKTIVPTTQERHMRDGDFIVSKTDTSGRIIYGNPTFIEFSGYREEELLGAQHNIIRHPDMPRSVFNLLWSEIKERREVFAYVKNMAKDGSFYWVFANVTPDLDRNGDITGFFSVRRRPRRSAIQAVQALYSQILHAEQNAGARDAVAAGTRVLVEALNGSRYEDFVLAV